MKSSSEYPQRNPEQPASMRGRQRHRPEARWREPDFWVRPTAICLPYLEIEVPLLIGSRGLHMVPVAPICRALHIDATSAIRTSQKKFLWSHAELLPLRFPQGGRKPPLVAFAWCLDYPLSLGSWMGNIAAMVQDQEQRQQLHRVVEAAMEVYGLAFDQVHQKYESGRHRMYALATNTSRLQDLYDQLRSQLEDHDRRATLAASPDASGLAHELLVTQWLTPTRAFLDQIQAFLNQWSEHQQNEIVTDMIQVDEQGHVIGNPTSFAPFAVFTDEQQRQLQTAEASCARLLREGEALLRGDEGTYE